MSALTTTITELPDSRVRVEAEVAAEEVERRIKQAASALGRELRVPGFRVGKVPPAVVIRRVGRSIVLDEAVRESLTVWYSDAIDAAGVHPVGDPDVDLGDLPSEGEPLTFSIEIGVRPPAELGAYKGLEVPRRAVSVPEEKIDEEIELLRGRVAKLESVDRAAADGDYVVMDFVGTIDGEEFSGGQGADQLIGLGTGRLVGDFEQQLEGSAKGDHKTVNVTFPEDYKATELAGRPAVFEVDVKDVQTRVLPELDDEFAFDHAGVDTFEELREEIRARLALADERTVEGEFREAALDAIVMQARINVPEALAQARAQELWSQMMNSLRRQGLSKEMYLQITGKEEEQIIADTVPEADRALRREAVLAAIVEAEGEALAPSREDLMEALAEAAEHEKLTPEKMLARLERDGRLDVIVDDVKQRKVLELIVEHSKAVEAPAEPAEPAAAKAKAPAKPKAKAKAKPKAKAKDAEPKIWTPEQGDEAPAADASDKLWTPGS